MKVRFKIFTSQFASHEKVFERVTEFATQLGRDKLISISHSEDKGSLTATVWYWGEDEERTGGSGIRKPPSGIMTMPQAKKEPGGEQPLVPPEPAKPPPAPPPPPEVSELGITTMLPWRRTSIKENGSTPPSDPGTKAMLRRVFHGDIGDLR